LDTVTVHGDRFNFPSGRSVWIEQLKMWRTYAGVIEGVPPKEYMFERIAQSVNREHSQKVFIVGRESSEEILPNYTWIAKLESDKGTTTDDNDYHSTLYVCWFADRIARDFHQEMALVLSSVHWEKHAVDYDTDNF
jgi:hypothetical protein